MKAANYIFEKGFYALTGLISELRSTSIYSLIFLAILFAGVSLGVNMMPDEATYHDENFHNPQIQAFIRGDLDYRVDVITVLPGYHALVAGVSALFFDDSIRSVRIASALLSLFSVLFFYLCAKRLGHRSPLTSTVLFFLCPLFFPFFFVIYTDMASLAFILAGVYATLCRRFSWAAIILTLSMLLRQTNVIMLAFCWLLAFSLYLEGKDLRQIRLREWGVLGYRFALKTSLFAVGILVFLGFVLWNGGVAVGDAGAHKIERLYFTQSYFWLLAVCIIYLPLHISNLPKIWLLIKEKPIWPIICGLAFAVYFISFWTYHGYNDFNFFLRNQIITWAEQGYMHRAILFVPMMLALLSLAVTPLRNRWHYWIYPFAIISLLPHSLIEQRYFMETIALFMLFKRDESTSVQYHTMAVSIVMSAVLFVGIGEIKLFL